MPFALISKRDNPDYPYRTEDQYVQQLQSPLTSAAKWDIHKVMVRNLQPLAAKLLQDCPSLAVFVVGWHEHYVATRT